MASDIPICEKEDHLYLEGFLSLCSEVICGFISLLIIVAIVQLLKQLLASMTSGLSKIGDWVDRGHEQITAFLLQTYEMLVIKAAQYLRKLKLNQENDHGETSLLDQAIKNYVGGPDSRYMVTVPARLVATDEESELLFFLRKVYKSGGAQKEEHAAAQYGCPAIEATVPWVTVDKTANEAEMHGSGIMTNT